MQTSTPLAERPAPAAATVAPLDAPAVSETNVGAEPIEPVAPPAGSPLKLIVPYRQSNLRAALFQLITTGGAFVGLWALALYTLPISPWIPLAISVPLGGVIVRLFIFQHDCGHGSFFASERANRTLGTLLGYLLFTPYAPWRHDHAVHHATTGDLDRRGVGDVFMMTVDQYKASTPMQRLGYRLFRNPFVMFGAGPFAVFIVIQRFPFIFNTATAKERESVRFDVHTTSVMCLGISAAVFFGLGWQAFFLIYVPSLWLAGSAGVFLFYVQHQFPTPYWRHTDAWDYEAACMAGSSHLKLHPVLAWFSGNIGVHHVHHLSPRIPNYNLQRCMRELPELRAETTLSLWEGLGTWKLKLYDEAKGKMVGFSDLDLAA